MPYLSETSGIPAPLPGEDDLPCDDGEPMETEEHRRQMILLIDTLEFAWRDRNDFYVSGNMFLYFSQTQTKKNDFRGPDVFVVLDTVRRMRKSWVVWQEKGRMPNVVIELLSESTEHIDRGEKMRLYANVLQVGDYYLYDPLTGVFEGFALNVSTKTYQPLKPNKRGDLRCRQLGLWLGRRRTLYGITEFDYLRWLDADGNPLPTGEERSRNESERARQAELQARNESERARQAELQARNESERAAKAEQQAEALAKRLADYQQRFGPLGI